MGKLFKIIGAIIGIVIVLVIALVIAATVFFDPNDFKQEITAKVKENTGRELLIKGDINLTIFPWLGVELGELELSNAKGFGKKHFARISSANVRIKLLPLLKKQVKMDTVSLDGLDLNLIRAKSGKTNWDDMMAAAKQPGKEAGEKKEEKKEPSAPPLAALALGGFNVTSAHVIWDDRQSGSRYEIDKLALKTGNLTPGAPFDLNMEFDLKSKAPAIGGHISLDSEVAVNPSSGSYAMKDTRLHLSLSGKDIPAKKLLLKLEADIDADLIKQTLALANVKLDTLGMHMEGNINAKQVLKALSFTGKLNVAEFNPRTVITSLGSELPRTTDARALNSASMSMTLAGTKSSVKFNNLKAKLDDTTLSGNFAVRNFTSKAMAFDLKLNAIDLDRYLPPSDNKTAASVSPTFSLVSIASAAPANSGPPLDALRKLNMSGKFRINQFKIKNLRSTNISITVAARDGLIKLSPISASLYEGKYSGNIQFDARKQNGNMPKLSANEKLSGVKAGPMLKDYMNKVPVTGTASLSANVSARGSNAKQMTKTLNGRVSFGFKDGAVKGVNQLQDILQNVARLRGLPPPPGNKTSETLFSSFGGSLVFTNGVGRNRDLKLVSPDFVSTGKGTVDLPRDHMKFSIKTKVSDTLMATGLKKSELKFIRGKTIPVEINCSISKFSSACVKYSVVQLLKGEVTRKINKKVDKAIEKKLGDKIDKKTKEKLKDIFKGIF